MLEFVTAKLASTYCAMPFYLLHDSISDQTIQNNVFVSRCHSLTGSGLGSTFGYPCPSSPARNQAEAGPERSVRE